MKQILASIKPYYYYLVAEGIKTIEVRKRKPSIEDWDKKTWFYMSKDEKSFSKIPKEFQEKYRKHFGKVGMRFVCDKIDKIFQCNSAWVQEHACISREEYFKYLGLPYNSHFDSKGAYAWHITDLVVYDEPRELRDFKPYNRKEEDCKFSHLGLAIPKCKDCCECYVKRPYQSWGYVEATEPRQTAD